MPNQREMPSSAEGDFKDLCTDGYEKRKLKTKEALQQAFVALLNEKPYDDISIREIAQRADVGFKSFYRHYSDKMELTQDLTQGFVNQLYAHFEPMTSLDASLRNLRRVLDIVAENASTVRAIGRAPERDKLVRPVTENAAIEASHFQNAAGAKLTLADQHRHALISHHFAQSQLIFFFWWVENDMKIPIDEMVNIIAELVIKPIWRLHKS